MQNYQRENSAAMISTTLQLAAYMLGCQYMLEALGTSLVGCL